MTGRVAAAREAWRRLRKVLGRVGVVEALTINDDFANAVADVPALLATRQPLWVGVQECLRSTFRERLGTRWGVRQRLTNEATRGVAVIWDRIRCRAIGRHVDKPHRRGRGWRELADSPATRPRGVVWQDVALRRHVTRTVRVRLRVRVASAHRFPQRERDCWPKFDEQLAKWILACPAGLHLVLSMDCNEAGGPAGLLALLEAAAPGRFRWVGRGIDGVLTDLHPAGVAQALRRGTSDHLPVSVPLDLTKEHR